MQASAKANYTEFDRELLDQDLLVQRCMGNHALVQHLLSRYADLVARDCDLLETALQDRDTKALAQVAHRLKGTSATVGSKRTCDLAAQIEQESRTPDWTSLQSTIAEIRQVHLDVTEHCRRSLQSYSRIETSGGDR